VAVTALVVEGDEKRALAAGMDDYIPKPVSVERVRAVLRHWGPPEPS
jgi:CheY-like chemotaxis protein